MELVSKWSFSQQRFSFQQPISSLHASCRGHLFPLTQILIKIMIRSIRCDGWKRAASKAAWRQNINNEETLGDLECRSVATSEQAQSRQTADGLGQMTTVYLMLSSHRLMHHGKPGWCLCHQERSTIKENFWHIKICKTGFGYVS